jgi:hypothetical protein
MTLDELEFGDFSHIKYVILKYEERLGIEESNISPSFFSPYTGRVMLMSYVRG